MGKSAWAEQGSGGKTLGLVRALPDQWSPEGGSPQPFREVGWGLSEKGFLWLRLEDTGLHKMKLVPLPSVVLLRVFEMPTFYESLI